MCDTYDSGRVPEIGELNEVQTFVGKKKKYRFGQPSTTLKSGLGIWWWATMVAKSTLPDGIDNITLWRFMSVL